MKRGTNTLGVVCIVTFSLILSLLILVKLVYIYDIHDHCCCWMDPVSCFREIIFIEPNNFTDLTFFFIIHKCNYISIILVGVTKQNDKLPNSMDNHHLICPRQ